MYLRRRELGYAGVRMSARAPSTILSRAVERTVRTILATALVVLAGGAAYADTPQRDPALERGEHVARLVCSACHVVAANQEFPPLLNPPAPSFMEIADRPGSSVRNVRHFVLTTHWNPPYDLPLRMPDLKLLGSQADDVGRYLMSLRTAVDSSKPSVPTRP